MCVCVYHYVCMCVPLCVYVCTIMCVCVCALCNFVFSFTELISFISRFKKDHMIYTAKLHNMF